MSGSGEHREEAKHYNPRVAGYQAVLSAFTDDNTPGVIDQQEWNSSWVQNQSDEYREGFREGINAKFRLNLQSNQEVVLWYAEHSRDIQASPATKRAWTEGTLQARRSLGRGEVLSELAFSNTYPHLTKAQKEGYRAEVARHFKDHRLNNEKVFLKWYQQQLPKEVSSGARRSSRRRKSPRKPGEPGIPPPPQPRGGGSPAPRMIKRRKKPGSPRGIPPPPKASIKVEPGELEKKLRAVLIRYMHNPTYSGINHMRKKQGLMEIATDGNYPGLPHEDIVDDLMETAPEREHGYDADMNPRKQAYVWTRLNKPQFEDFMQRLWQTQTYPQMRARAKQSLWGGKTELHWNKIKDTPLAKWRVQRFFKILQAYRDGQEYPKLTGDNARDLDSTPPSWRQHETFYKKYPTFKDKGAKQKAHDDLVGRVSLQEQQVQGDFDDTHEPPPYAIKADLRRPYLGTWNWPTFITMMFIRDNNNPRSGEAIKKWITDNNGRTPWVKKLSKTWLNKLPIKRVQSDSRQFILDREKILDKCFGASKTVHEDMQTLVKKGTLPRGNNAERNRRSKWLKKKWGKAAPYSNVIERVFKFNAPTLSYIFSSENYRSIVKDLLEFSKEKDRKYDDIVKVKKKDEDERSAEARAESPEGHIEGSGIPEDVPDEALPSLEQQPPPQDTPEDEPPDQDTPPPPPPPEPEMISAQIGKFYRNGMRGISGKFLGIDPENGRYIMLTADGLRRVSWSPSWARAEKDKTIANTPVPPILFGKYRRGAQVVAIDGDAVLYIYNTQSGDQWGKMTIANFTRNKFKIVSARRFDPPEIHKRHKYSGFIHLRNKDGQYEYKIVRGAEIVGYDPRTNKLDLRVKYNDGSFETHESWWHPAGYTAIQIPEPPVNIDVPVPQKHYEFYAGLDDLQKTIKKGGAMARTIKQFVEMEKKLGKDSFTLEEWTRNGGTRSGWQMVTKRRTKNYFTETAEGGFALDFDGGENLSADEILRMFSGDYIHFPQQQSRDDELTQLLQFADSFEPKSFKVDNIELAALDHHHGQMRGFTKPGSMSAARSLRIAFQKHIDAGDFEVDEHVGAYNDLLQHYEKLYNVRYLDTKKHGPIHDPLLAEIQHEYGLVSPSHHLSANVPNDVAQQMGVARYIPDRKAKRADPPIHALTQLTIPRPPNAPPGEIFTGITDANPDDHIPYNLAGQARTNWGNNAHILETFAQHGGHKALEDYLGRDPRLGDDLQLKWLENKAKEVFARMKYEPARPDLENENWQMAHVTKLAAQRVRGFMTSGPHAHRTFKHKPERKREYVESRRQSHEIHHSASYNRYHLPLAKTVDFMRMAKLPGMSEYLHDESTQPEPRTPWFYHGPKQYNALMDKFEPFPNERRRTEDDYRADLDGHTFDMVGIGSNQGRQEREFYEVTDALQTLHRKVNFQFPQDVAMEPEHLPHAIPHVAEQHFNAEGQHEHAPIEGIFGIPLERRHVPKSGLLAMADILPRGEFVHYEGDFENKYNDAFTESSSEDDDDDLRKMFPDFFDIYNF